MDIISNNRDVIGSISIISGIIVIFLGVLFLLGKWLLAIGNLLFVGGMIVAIGYDRTFQMFFPENKRLATVLFFSGIVVMLLGWTVIGVTLEICGLVLLFMNPLPTWEDFLNLPLVKSAMKYIKENLVPLVVAGLAMLLTGIGLYHVILFFVCKYLYSNREIIINQVERWRTRETHKYTYINGVLVSHEQINHPPEQF